MNLGLKKTILGEGIRRPVGTLVLGLLSVLSISACGSEIEGRVASSITTTLVPDTVAAGQVSLVNCEVWSPDGDAVTEGDTTFESPDADGFTATATTVSATAAGTYRINCLSDMFGLRDDEGARLTVVPGAPKTVRTVLDNPKVRIYEVSNASCIVEDEFGNIIEGLSTTVNAPPEVSVTGYALSSEDLGVYEVECVLSDGTTTENTSATLTVTHGEPASVEIIAQPNNPRYFVGSKVSLTWIVRDDQGNLITGLPATLTHPGAGVDFLGEQDGGHRFEFLAEGVYTWTVQLDAPYDALTDDLTLVCDESGPTIVIDFPERGATLVGTGAEPVVVTGTATDEFGGMGAFEINGDPVSVAEDGSFSHALTEPLWGVNLIDVVAADAFGNLSELTPTFHYAAEYTSFVDADAAGLVEPDGLTLLMGQLFLDDGDHDHANPNDLATLMEILLGDLDIAGLLGNGGSIFNQVFPILDLPLINIGVFTLDITGDLTVDAKLVPPTGLGETMVTIDSRDGGIDTIIEMGNASENGLDLNTEIDLTVVLSVNWTFLFIPDSATVTGEASISSSVSAASLLFGVSIDMEKTADTDLVVDVKDLDLDIVGLAIDPVEDITFTFSFDLPLIGQQSLSFDLSQFIDLTALTDAILDPLTQQLLPVLLDLVTPLIETFADDVLVGLLSAFELTLPIPLPEILGLGGGEPKSIDVYTNLSSVDFKDVGGTLGLGFGVFAEKGVDREPLGAINREGCNLGLTEAFSYNWEKSLGFALKTDSVNALLFAVWWSGYLNGPLDAGALAGGALPIDGLVLELNPLLPPVLNDCTAKDGAAEIEIGDMWADVELDLLGTPIDAGIYMDLGLSVQFEAKPDGLYINILGLSFVDIEVIEIVKSEDGLFDPEDLLKDTLPGLLESFLAGQSFGPIALPAIDLSTILPGIAPGTNLELGDIGVSSQDGYTVLDSNLQ